MRLSSKRTTTAILRSIIGIKDFEMAEILKCSTATIHSLESGRLKVSEGMAKRLYDETNISPEWILAGDVTAAPVSARGEPYTAEMFHRAQSAEERNAFNAPHSHFLLGDALGFCAQLTAILSSARNRKEYSFASYRVGKAIAALRNEFGQDTDLYAEIGKGVNLTQGGKVLDLLQKHARSVADMMDAQLATLTKPPSARSSPASRKKRV